MPVTVTGHGAAFQGFAIEFFAADDATEIDDTFCRFVDEFLLAPF